MALTYNLEHGLLGQIQTLINPVPCSIDLSHDTRPDYRYQFYLRTQTRGVNHDVCDSCDESGDLVCCDSCPAAFHLPCTDPPMTEQDVEKLSTWSCKRCTYYKTHPSNSKPIAIKAEIGESMQIKSIFAQLVNHAKKTNPKEFKLPLGYGYFEPALPGTSRLVFKKSCPAKSRQVIIEMDNFVVPKPTVKCHLCSRNCRSGALIKCDICPAFYHLDCLDPPLTVPPTTIWECPLHPESSIEAKFLRSTMLSERVRLWDYTKELPCGYDIKRDFIRKARKNFVGPFLHKKPVRRPMDEIPQSIADSYSFQKPEIQEWTEQKRSEPEEGKDGGCDQMEWMSTVNAGERELVPTNTQMEPPLNALMMLASAAVATARIDELTNKLEFDAKKVVDQLDLNTTKYLAAEFLNRLHEENAAATKKEVTLVQEKENSSAPNEGVPTTLVLHCLTSGKNFRLTKSTIEVGLGSQADINLVDSQCKNISKRHATIHHDFVKNDWELLCYSTYGTMVNKSLYGCTQNMANGMDMGDMDSKAKDLFAQTIGSQKAALLDQAHASSPTKVKSPVKAGVKDCECSKSGIWNGPTCEESVKIKQNDLVQFGCLKFVVLSAVLNEVD